MAKKKAAAPRSFSGVVKERSKPIQVIARAMRALLYELVPDAEERFSGGPRPIAMYRTSADICFIQPQLRWCNMHFLRGTELTDPDALLEGSSDRMKHVKVRTLEEVATLPLRDWIRETIELNEQLLEDHLGFDEVLERVRPICLSLPKTKETVTWGKPHFRVGEKIFGGCGEVQGRPIIGLKMEPRHSELMMRTPGIEKAAYSRPGDGWVAIDPNVFDDWDEIREALIGSYRLIAPKKTLALLDDQ